MWIISSVKVWDVFKYDNIYYIITNTDWRTIHYLYTSWKTFSSDYDNIEKFENSSYSRVKCTNININNIEIKYFTVWNNVYIIRTLNKKVYTLDMKYIWDVKDFVSSNKIMILNYFDDIINNEITEIFKDLDIFLNNYLKKLLQYKSDYVSPLVLTKLLDVIKKNVINITEEFSNDINVKKQIINLFSNKK